jgi:hypothetical protein
VDPERTNSRWLFLLAALEAGAAFFTVTRVPHSGSGISLSRIMILAVIFAFFIFWIYLAFRTPKWFTKTLQPGYALMSGLLGLIFATALFLIRYLEPVRFLVYYQRISPLLIYLILITTQYSIFNLVSHFGFHPDKTFTSDRTYSSALTAFAITIGVFLFVTLTRIGITPDSAYWGEPGVPLMGWQFGVAIFGGLSILLLNLQFRNSPRLEVILPVMIWLIAVVIWLNVPNSVMQNSFYGPISPPANQPYPNSDAGYYDTMAQSLLIGYPYLGDIPTRPLYIIFLGFLHWLAGDRFDLIIAGQTLILAFIPVLLYLLGRKLHSRSAGAIIALFAIFRELTSLLISSQTRVSNTKTLLVDLPTLLLLLLACIFVLRWMERKDWRNGLIAGGMFGLLLLLRTQSLVILPVLFVVVILVYGFRNRSWAPALGFFLIGFIITIAPWILHNYLRTGQVTFDAPFEYQVIASQYKYTGNLDLQNVDLQGKSLFGILMTFAIKDPKFVLGFIATHFLATQINSLLALPLIAPYNGLFAPINLYWMSWNGSLSWYNLLVVLIYLVVIAIGLGSVWKHLRWMGLIPLAFSLGYSLANGVGRFSGWRYDLPADWISYFYFGIGIAEIFGIIAMSFGAKRERIFTPILEEKMPDQKRLQDLPLTGILICVFVMVSALPWFAEGLVGPRYTDQTAAKLVSTLSNSPSVQIEGISPAEIEMFMASPQATLQIGRMVYPRFFTRNQGLSSSHPWPAYAPRDFPRLGFVLLNQTRRDIIFPTHTNPNNFPSTADAIILGCQRTDYIEVRLIYFPDIKTAALSTPLSIPCN